MADPKWFFVEDGERVGPVDKEELVDMALHGMIGPDTLVWADGMADWAPAENHFIFGAPQDGASPPIARPVAQAQSPDDLGFPLTNTGQQRQFKTTPGSGLGPDGLYVGAPSRGFGDAVAVCFRKYVAFSGRASRSEYWFFYLFYFLGSIVLSFADSMFFRFGGGVGILGGLFALVMFLPTLAATVRRLHDTDRSGWWIGGYVVAMIACGLLFLVAFAIAFGGYSGSNLDDMTMVVLVSVGGIALGIYSIAIFVFMVLKGTLGPNRFG